MPVEAKPLFRPDVLRAHLEQFSPPPVDSDVLNRWAEDINSKKVQRFREQELLPQFLNDYFVGLLGYRGPAGHNRFTIRFEKSVEVDGKRADAVLGEFNGHDRYVVAVEGKGPKDPLDRPFAGRRKSAVEQGYQYAINLQCDWIIVTSIAQTRLYHKGSNQQTYERFETEKLADDEEMLRRFLFLLGADRVVPESGSCHFYGLLAESEQVGRDLTKKYYINYADIRQDAFERLTADNPAASRRDVLACTQKVLDRVLFVAFSEDRGLLPANSIRKAYQHHDPYHPRPIWDNFRGLFNAINEGNSRLGIHGYNGGLFALDPLLESLKVSDEVCGYFRDLGEYDYRPAHAASGDNRVIDVEILGHIFEQSISDLERLQNEVDGREKPVGVEKHKTRRKKEGAFYTPDFITRYIIEQALGGVLRDRYERLRETSQSNASGRAQQALVDPRVYELKKLTKPAKSALVKFWEAWQEELKTIRLLDPACGSGAFLIEAFDQLYTAYQRSNDRLAELRGQRSFFDVDKQILEHNLYGVDLNSEAVEIARLSLWIKTAQHGKKLTSLDHTIRVGNSVVSDKAYHPKAFDWRNAFPEVFEAGGFDVVVGNPPYVRHELLTPLKPHWESRFSEIFAGTADLYTYFYAIGVEVLRPGGRLAFISSNGFARAGFAEKLREFLSTKAVVQQYIDLGDTQVFSDAKDVYPAILCLSKPSPKVPVVPNSIRVLMLRRSDNAAMISELAMSDGWNVPSTGLRKDGWQLDEPRVVAMRDKLVGSGVSLGELPDVQILMGLKTGLNEAFVVDDFTRKQLIDKDPKSGHILKPFVGGQDIQRWFAHDSGSWLILLADGTTRAATNSRDEKAGWNWLTETYPAIADHLRPFEDRGRKRTDQGEFWWELRPCVYYNAFAQPKIMYPDIAKSNRFLFDKGSLYSANTSYFLTAGDWFLLGVLNSKATWFSLAGISVPFGERAGEFRYRLFSQYMTRIPIPPATRNERDAISTLAEKSTEMATERHEKISYMRRRLESTFGESSKGSLVGKLNQKAEAWWEQSFGELGAALRTSFKLSKSPFSNPRTADEWEPYVSEKRMEVERLTRDLADAENEINDRVYRLFHLTDDEIKLIQREVEH